jgi:hypothetical protein
MIATKTATLMVAMAVMGIVPVAAHAQDVDIEEIAAIESAVESATAANTEQTSAQVDNDENKATNVAFATVGSGGSFSAGQGNTINDEDSLTNEQTADTSATSTTSSTNTLTAEQNPTMTVAEVLALL